MGWQALWAEKKYVVDFMPGVLWLGPDLEGGKQTSGLVGPDLQGLIINQGHMALISRVL